MEAFPTSADHGGSIMRGRKPVGPEYAEKLSGSDIAKLRAKVILETIAGTCRVQEACERLNISEQRFHQLREEMMAAAVKALEPGHAGRPAHTPTPAEEQVVTLEQQLVDKEVELRAAKARAEIAVIMPDVQHSPSGRGDGGEPEKKTPPPRPKRRRRGRKRNT
jgi:hypothetical protein